MRVCTTNTAGRDRCCDGDGGAHQGGVRQGPRQLPGTAHECVDGGRTRPVTVSAMVSVSRRVKSAPAGETKPTASGDQAGGGAGGRPTPRSSRVRRRSSAVRSTVRHGAGEGGVAGAGGQQAVHGDRDGAGELAGQPQGGAGVRPGVAGDAGGFEQDWCAASPGAARGR